MCVCVGGGGGGMSVLTLSVRVFSACNSEIISLRVPLMSVSFLNTSSTAEPQEAQEGGVSLIRAVIVLPPPPLQEE